jgi:hypothetical protein
MSMDVDLGLVRSFLLYLHNVVLFVGWSSLSSINDVVWLPSIYFVQVRDFVSVWSHPLILDMRIPKIRAITNTEFVQLMSKCRPPVGWPATIGS